MTAIVCVSKNWGIGKDGDLLFRIRADLRRFRELTTGKCVVMGKNTLLALPGGKGLPNRRNIVISSTLQTAEGCEIVPTVEEALALAGEDAIIIGGGQLYKTLLPHCKKVLLTLVDAEVEADTFFPNLDEHPDWGIASCEDWQEEDGLRFRYIDYVNRTV